MKVLEKLNSSFEGSRLGAYFKLKERGSTLTREALAGLVTFVTLAYIIPVNASILSATGGPCPEELGCSGFDECFANPEYLACDDTVKQDLITATALCSAFSCFLMGAVANLPIMLAPGMGMNAYFAFTVVGFAGSGNVTYATALGAVLIEGIIFLVISATGIRTRIALAFPACVKIAMTAGIGLFLTHIGLQASEGLGVVVYNNATLVTLGACPPEYRQETDGGNYECVSHKLHSTRTWIGFIGLCIIAVLLNKKVRGAMLIGVSFVSFLSWFRGTSFTQFPYTEKGDADFDYFKQVVAFNKIEKTWLAMDFNLGSAEVWLALITFLYTDLLDATGTLQAVAKQTGLVKDDGSFEKMDLAFCSDATGIIFGSLFGLSPITAFIESAAGIESGGRTGLVAIFGAVFFLISIFFAPIISNIPPWATGGALCITGSLMMECVTEIDWKDKKQAIPAFGTMVMMPLTYSIAYGIVTGLMLAFVMYTSHYLWEIAVGRMTWAEAREEIASGSITRAHDPYAAYHAEQMANAKVIDNGVPQKEVPLVA